MPASTFTVRTAAEFREAILQARGGDTILMAPGIYEPIGVRGDRGFVAPESGRITIRSEDPADPARITELGLREVHGLDFENLIFDYRYADGDPEFKRPFFIRDSSDIAIRDSTFSGSLVDGVGHGFGLSVSRSTNIAVENNDFHDFMRGAVFGRVDDLTVTGNEIHRIRSDGLNFIQVQNVLIEDNHLHSFIGKLGSRDHRDMIQLWSTGTDAPSADIVIRGNVLDIADGHWTQSLFMRNEVVDSQGGGPDRFYRNILIEDNIIYNAHLHGITVGETDGLVIRNNSVLYHEGAPLGRTGGVTIPQIRVAERSTDVVIERNVVAAISGVEDRGDWIIRDNVIVDHTDAAAPGYYLAQFVTSTMDHRDGALKHVALPDSEIAARAAGAPQLLPEESPETIRAAFQVSGVSGTSRELVFDAGLTRGPSGAVPPEEARFIWRFGDGTVAEGQQLRHAFAGPGAYDVVLEVIAKDGSRSLAQHAVRISGERIVSLDAERGGFLLHAFGEETLAPVAAERLVETGSGTALRLGNDGERVGIARNNLTSLFSADDFEIAMTLQGASHGEVARVHSTFILTVLQNGNLRVDVFPDDGSRVVLRTQHAVLNDGQAHDVSVRFSGTQGELSILVGGEVAAVTEFSGAVRSMGNWGLVFGNPWSDQNFEGLLSDFELRAVKPDYPVHVGPSGAVTLSTDAPVTTPIPAQPDAGSEPEPIVPERDGHEDGGRDGTDHGAIEPPIRDAIEPPMQTALLHDGFVLDPIADPARIRLINDSRLVLEDGGYTIRHEFEGSAAHLGRLEPFEASQQLGFSVEYSNFVSGGRLVWNHLKVGLEVYESRLRVAIQTAEDGVAWLSVDAPGLAGNSGNRVTVLADAEADRLQVIVNDRVVLDETETDIDFVGAGGREWGWYLGAPWGDQFSGDIHDFRVSDRFEFLEVLSVPEDTLPIV